MLIYRNSDNLVTTSLGDPYENWKLQLIHREADHFGAKDNRFYKITAIDSIPRSIKHPTRYSMEIAAIRKYKNLTGTYDTGGFYDEKNNVWHELFLFITGGPKIFTYDIVYPVITDFFQYWNSCSKNDGDIYSSFDLARLFSGMANFHDLSLMVSKERGKQLESLLYQNFPEFAIFYYEIYPYLTIETLKTYNIPKLVNARLQVHELGLDSEQLDQLFSAIPIADNNTKVLRLIKRAQGNNVG